MWSVYRGRGDEVNGQEGVSFVILIVLVNNFILNTLRI